MCAIINPESDVLAAAKRNANGIERRDRGVESTSNVDDGTQAPRHIIILSDIRFVREGLATVLERDGGFKVVGVAADPEGATPLVMVQPPPVVLIDAGLSDGLSVVVRLRSLVPAVQIVAFALSETEAQVIAWAQAGVCGYLPRDAALAELSVLMDKIMRREQICSTQVTAGLLRWIATAPRVNAGSQAQSPGAVALTSREGEIARLVAVGLSNKAIARRLDIGLATVKSHVHSILGKLMLQRRGELIHWAGGGKPLPFHPAGDMGPGRFGG